MNRFSTSRDGWLAQVLTGLNQRIVHVPTVNVRNNSQEKLNPAYGLVQASRPLPALLFLSGQLRRLK
jgi:hypothetical protein